MLIFRVKLHHGQLETLREIKWHIFCFPPLLWSWAMAEVADTSTNTLEINAICISMKLEWNQFTCTWPQGSFCLLGCLIVMSCFWTCLLQWQLFFLTGSKLKENNKWVFSLKCLFSNFNCCSDLEPRSRSLKVADSYDTCEQDRCMYWDRHGTSWSKNRKRVL